MNLPSFLAFYENPPERTPRCLLGPALYLPLPNEAGRSSKRLSEEKVEAAPDISVRDREPQKEEL